MADKMRSNRSAEREWPERLRPEQPVQMTDPNFHTDTGGWAEVHRDEWAQNLVGMLGKKVNRWAQNVRPGGFAMPEDRPSGLHVILTITTDGPTVDVISENVNRPGAYADGLGNSDGWAQSSVFGPGKGNGRAQSPIGRCRRMGPELNLISDNGGQAIVHGRYTQLRWMGPDVDLTVQNVPNNDGRCGRVCTPTAVGSGADDTSSGSVALAAIGLSRDLPDGRSGGITGSVAIHEMYGWEIVVWDNV
ncbi:uncharacterized protein F5891DRAFT_985592 [Suillus fuscotomentosus]|uniref:Uncharacterized protein n=1 Tax=Suillus fuscotomentosus TaxID=1912939 RepID=A0AAD4DWA2_9AGAM|nr:uncharacterized protein F5891DRAFT_985592 [Suillus fuscotomentosus]KAG1893778.1 hypothetical protein F5891DRAFT_985592 [Suillus fuscotomentosus]